MFIIKDDEGRLLFAESFLYATLYERKGRGTIYMIAEDARYAIDQYREQDGHCSGDLHIVEMFGGPRVTVPEDDLKERQCKASAEMFVVKWVGDGVFEDDFLGVATEKKPGKWTVFPVSGAGLFKTRKQAEEARLEYLDQEDRVKECQLVIMSVCMDDNRGGLRDAKAALTASLSD